MVGVKRNTLTSLTLAGVMALSLAGGTFVTPLAGNSVIVAKAESTIPKSATKPKLKTLLNKTKKVLDNKDSGMGSDIKALLEKNYKKGLEMYGNDKKYSDQDFLNITDVLNQMTEGFDGSGNVISEDSSSIEKEQESNTNEAESIAKQNSKNGNSDASTESQSMIGPTTSVSKGNHSNDSDETGTIGVAKHSNDTSNAGNTTHNQGKSNKGSANKNLPGTDQEHTQTAILSALGVLGLAGIAGVVYKFSKKNKVN